MAGDVTTSQGFKLFGWEIKKGGVDPQSLPSFAPEVKDDGANYVEATPSVGAFNQTYVDLENSARTDAELVRRYRDMALQPEVDIAVTQICNELVVTDEQQELVELDLERADELPPAIKEIMVDTFHKILNLLEFNTRGWDVVRRWYVEGRIYFHAIIDPNNPQAGIQELRPIDPTCLQKMRNFVRQRDPRTGAVIFQSLDDYYVFNEKGFGTQATGTGSMGYGNQMTGIRIASDCIIECTSGLTSGKQILSYMQKAIKPVNQLRAIEDAAVIYLLVRAPARRVFYVDTGTLPKMQAEQHLRDMMVSAKNKLVYDPTSGCFDMDTKVPLLDGRVLSIRDIAIEMEQGKELWAYSCDPISGKIIPGLITWAGITQESAKVMKITLDNGEEIICTPEHNFPIWDRGFLEAKDLTIGESMIPLYRRQHPIMKGKSKYEQIFDNDTKKWGFTHRMVGKFKDDVGIREEWTYDEKYTHEPKTVLHHKNYNRFDNSPTNLTKMTWKDHSKYHNDMHNPENSAKGIKRARELRETDPAWNAKVSQSIRDSWTPEMREQRRKEAKERYISTNGENFKNSNDSWKKESIGPARRTKMVDSQIIEYTDDLKNIVRMLILKDMKPDEICSEINTHTDVISKWKYINKNKITRLRDINNLTFIGKDLTRVCKLLGFKGRDDCRYSLLQKTPGVVFSKSKKKWQVSYKSNGKQMHGGFFTTKEEAIESRIRHNHKIVSIEYLPDPIQVGTLTIDGDEKFHGHHTFALEAGIFTKNSIRDDRLQMTLLDDIWLARREGNKTTEIQTLESSGTLVTVELIDFFLKKVYNALNVPLSRLMPETMYSMGGLTSGITRDEANFNLFIGRLRTRFSMLFLEILERELILQNIIKPEEWDSLKHLIRFKYARENAQAELKDLDIMTQRINVLAGVMPFVGRYYSNEFIRKNILHQNEEDIEREDKQIAEEMMNPQYRAPLPGEDPMMGDGSPMSQGPGSPMAPPLDPDDKKKS